MVTFGLITEGITDQIVIENILMGYFAKNEDDIEFKELQPLRDETDENKAQNYGGWDKVLEYCASSKFKGALQFHDYIIVQIDTDVSDKPEGYGIPHFEQGKALTTEQLIEKVVAKFIDLIGKTRYEKYEDKIIFAISVHSIECWLLPLCYDDNRKAKIVNCMNTVDDKLKKSGMKMRLQNKKGEKNVESYRELSEKYCKHKTLLKLYSENPSLKIFIHDVKKRNIIINEEDYF
jgi:hypothetical protein